MGLRDAIPGLKAHETIINPPVQVTSFNDAAALNLVRSAFSDVNSSFPSPDVWVWLRQNRPDVISELKRFGHDMNVAYQAQNMTNVKASADLFVRAHKRAWKLFEERPPIIDRQDALFDGGA
jgi:hypothetical protein